jgi:RecJ-like exonuclease
MDIQTRLSLGDRFYYIGYNSFIGQETCRACDGEGKIYFKDGSSDYCPKCYGKGHIETYGKENWHVLNNNPADLDYDRPVGKITVEITGGKRKQDVKIAYSPLKMGNYYYEENCFPTLDEAEKECKKRNSELSDNA